MELGFNPVVANEHSWRMLLTGLNSQLFTILIPILIFVCRYINWSFASLSKNGNSIAAGIIILFIGQIFLYLAALLAQRSPLIALPAAINNTNVNQSINQSKEVPLQQIVITDPNKVGNQPAINQSINQSNQGQYTDAQHLETTVTQEHDHPTNVQREYSGNHQPATMAH